jgi:hypothetical protein
LRCSVRSLQRRRQRRLRRVCENQDPEPGTCWLLCVACFFSHSACLHSPLPRAREAADACCAQ